MAKKRKQPKSRTTTSQYRQYAKQNAFSEHVQEIRNRLFFVAISVVSFSVAGYIIQKPLIAFLLYPAADQQFIYTTPGGGLNFLLQVCVYFGIALSLPIIVFHLLRFIEPLFRRSDKRFIIKATFFSAVLAFSGMAFGYFVGLPAALHFLAGQFQNKQVEALLTISEYLSFVTVYLTGAAVMFQLPLVLLLINRITPLGTRKLLSNERWVIVFAFVAAAIITPTPDLINQSIIAGPIILTYQIGVFLVWWTNKRTKRDVISRLHKEDKAKQQERWQVAETASPLPVNPVDISTVQKV
jgi:sec-independent protein translocase protein TatC